MNSKFSDFFRLATYEEKERVWKEIVRKSCEDQQEIINKANQMSALNEKKVNPFTNLEDKGIIRAWLVKKLLRLILMIVGESKLEIILYKPEYYEKFGEHRIMEIDPHFKL